MRKSANPLSLFHPLIAQWFESQIGQPTDVQQQSWPKIANGEHVLITAPTGSGKTLTAFLWAINQLVTKERSTGYTSVLYISPLKALNNDIYRNLLEPLGSLKQLFEENDKTFPDIRVQTRSGDTPESDRRRMERHPPEILITTPESLNLLLSSNGGRSMLRSISTVILDEIHSVIGTKRGVHLITAVDRLIPLSGEFQRIALSATIRPMETVAQFVGGCTIDGDLQNPRYTSRTVSLVRSTVQKQYQVQVRFPKEAVTDQSKESVWKPLVAELKKIISDNQSTLLFTNSRRLCERLTHKINNEEERPIAYSHHGSLSREIREEVESKLKLGELQAIVATNSLEMGIDIGALDEVVLIQSPPSISSAIQRIGRAGHQVGQVSHGTIFPTHSQDFLEAAVMTEGILSQDIEAVKPIQGPLDVLAQVLVSMVGVEMWDIDALYTQIRSSYPYRSLSQEQFDLVLNMLGGRYADSRIRELKPRISIDRLDNTVCARKGALLALYMSGGTIPDRGYFHIRHNETNAVIGELDEEFVWEASVGQTFTLGTQNWKIDRITHNDVFVVSGNPKAMAAPFWKGENNNRDFHFSEKIASFLKIANDYTSDLQFADALQNDNCMDETAAKQLIAFLQRQKERTGCDLPHRHHLLLEFVNSGPDGVPGNQLVLHTMWGGCVNRPFAMALDAAWQDRFNQRLEIFAGNDSIVLLLPHEISGDEFLSLVTSSTVERLLKKRLEGSGFFGARFRECAGRALLLSRNKMNERMPLWMNRLRSQKLMESILQYNDFPILLEAWRTCLQDEFDLDSLKQMLTELESGSISWSQLHTNHPSPMAQSMVWNQVSQYMYMGDEPSSERPSQLRGSLLRDVVFSPGLRPTISREHVEQFEQKRKRLSPGYSPETSRDLLDWIKERLLLPASEWELLLQAIHRDHDTDADTLLQPIAEKIVWITPPASSESLLAAVEIMPRIIYGFYGDKTNVEINLVTNNEFPKVELPVEGDRDELLTTLLGEWLQFYGPTTDELIYTTLGIEKSRLQLALEDLVDSQKIITGQLVTDGIDNEICDSDNFEILLRIARAEAVPAFEPRRIEDLPLFLANHQGIINSQQDVDGLVRRIEQLLCFATPAEIWESEILPARMYPYHTSWLDSIMQEADLQWIGSENHRVAFCFESDMYLLHGEVESPTPAQITDEVMQNTSSIDNIFPDTSGHYDFSTLLRTLNHSPEELSNRLWEAVWQGQVSNDTFMALRRGIENSFKAPKVAAENMAIRRSNWRTGGRVGFSKWKGSLPFAGNWFRLQDPDLSVDLLDIEERKKDRVRLLLDRYGILFRELLQNETPAFRWTNIFRSLRLMELSGEILSGYFFEGVTGPQFISHQAFRMLQRKLPESAIYWINATDPASICGLPLDELRGSLPKRVGGTHLVFHGNKLVAVSNRKGKELLFNVPSNDPHLQEYFGFLQHLLTRQFQPVRRITIETINNEESAQSPYIEALRISFDVVVDYKSVVIYRKVN